MTNDLVPNTPNSLDDILLLNFKYKAIDLRAVGRDDEAEFWEHLTSFMTKRTMNKTHFKEDSEFDLKLFLLNYDCGVPKFRPKDDNIN